MLMMDGRYDILRLFFTCVSLVTAFGIWSNENTVSFGVVQLIMHSRSV